MPGAIFLIAVHPLSEWVSLRLERRRHTKKKRGRNLRLKCPVQEKGSKPCSMRKEVLYEIGLSEKV